MFKNKRYFVQNCRKAENLVIHMRRNEDVIQFCDVGSDLPT